MTKPSIGPTPRTVSLDLDTATHDQLKEARQALAQEIFNRAYKEAEAAVKAQGPGVVRAGPGASNPADLLSPAMTLAELRTRRFTAPRTIVLSCPSVANLTEQEICTILEEWSAENGA